LIKKVEKMIFTSPPPRLITLCLLDAMDENNQLKKDV